MATAPLVYTITNPPSVAMPPGRELVLERDFDTFESLVKDRSISYDSGEAERSSVTKKARKKLDSSSDEDLVTTDGVILEDDYTLRDVKLPLVHTRPPKILQICTHTARAHPQTTFVHILTFNSRLCFSLTLPNPLLP